MYLRGWMFWPRRCKRRTIEHGSTGVNSLAYAKGALLNILALHDSSESVRQLVHYDLGQIIAGHTRNIAVAHGVFSNQHIVSETRGIACGRGDTDVCLRT